MLALIAKEFQTWIQSRAMFILVGLVVLFLGACAFLLGLLILTPFPGSTPSLFGAFVPPGATQPPANDANVLPSSLVPHRATLLYGAGALSMLLMIVAVAPALAATAFGFERTSGTLEMLLLHSEHVSRATAAKILGATLFVGLLCVLGAPTMAPAWMVGNVDVGVVASIGAVLIATTLLACAIGVLYSALIRDTLAAAFLAQATMFGITFVIPGVVLVVNEATGGAAELHKHLLWLSPLVGVLSGAADASASVLAIAPSALRLALTPPPIPPFLLGLLGAAWVPSVLLWLVSAAVCWYAAGVAIDPCHPARRWRRRTTGGSGGARFGSLRARTREVQA